MNISSYSKIIYIEEIGLYKIIVHEFGVEIKMISLNIIAGILHIFIS